MDSLGSLSLFFTVVHRSWQVLQTAYSVCIELMNMSLPVGQRWFVYVKIHERTSLMIYIYIYIYSDTHKYWLHVIFCYNFMHWSRVTLPHSSLPNSSSYLIFCGFRLWTLTFKVFQKFTIGFKSGDWLGQLRVLISLFSNHSFVSFAVCLGSLSCWSTKFRPCPKEVADFWRFFSIISLYMLPFVLLWITFNSPVLLDEKYPIS